MRGDFIQHVIGKVDELDGRRQVLIHSDGRIRSVPTFLAAPGIVALGVVSVRSRGQTLVTVGRLHGDERRSHGGVQRGRYRKK